MKTASSVGPKWAERAGSSAQSYLQGSENTTKDQAALAIAAKANWAAAVAAAATKDLFAKGLQRSGKQGWLNGIQQKGSQNYGVGVSSADAQAKYVTNSGRYDAARSAASSIARGPKGSQGNLQRVSAVMTAERAVKTS